jgi:hypothetical protein
MSKVVKEKNDIEESMVLPSRFRLSLSAFLLAFITIFDPSIMRGMLVAWHKSNRKKNIREKALILCGRKRGRNDE